MRDLSTALTHWTIDADPTPVTRWLERELDEEGVPRTLDVSQWPEIIRLFDAARAERPTDWPDEFEASFEALFEATLRFSRPDGSTVFGQIDRDEARRALYQRLARQCDDPSLQTVVDWWFPSSKPGTARHSAPPLPAHSRPGRVLAVLRSNWLKDGDFAAVDHRGRSNVTTFELNARGTPWLGPSWQSGDLADAKPLAFLPKPRHWISQSLADSLEWSFRQGEGKISRAVISLRGRGLTLLTELSEGLENPLETRIELAEGIEATTNSDRRGFALRSPKQRKSALILPLSLPKSTSSTDRGTFSIDEERRTLVLRQPSTGTARRSFRMLMVTTDSVRDRKPIDWRGLTVTEDGKTVGLDRAFATRVRWGRDDTLLIYRNHGKTATRAFLGHQSRARFLVGLFSKEGTVQPLLKIVDEAES